MPSHPYIRLRRRIILLIGGEAIGVGIIEEGLRVRTSKSLLPSSYN